MRYGSGTPDAMASSSSHHSEYAAKVGRAAASAASLALRSTGHRYFSRATSVRTPASHASASAVAVTVMCAAWSP